MADHNVIRPPRTGEGRATPEAGSGTIRETDQSSTAGSHRASRLHPVDGRPSFDNALQGESPRRRRAQNRSSRGFLLRDSVVRDRHLVRRRLARDPTRPDRGAPRTPDSVPSIADPDGSLALFSDVASRPSTASPRSRAKSSADSDNPITEDALPHQDLDVDSALIVNMALNLSESRSIAARRNISQGTPPRLAPVPDGGSVGNLRQHLQQQRRSSRNTIPRPRLATSSRVSSAAWLSGHLQPVPDAAHDSQYRYHFSASTLARAQKAKEHLELMAEYRRLLETLPPLDPGFQRHTTASPPTSPSGSKVTKFGSRSNVAHPSGRQYNPLQFIRNRKVRARERKVIDAERQGFGDVESVRSWVDKVCQRSSSLPTFSEDGDEPALPSFPGADALEGQPSDPTASRAAARVRRPRVDWFVEPCDMVADAYWLEQDHHKHLIEDRHWYKIFSPAADLSSLSRPITRDCEAPDNTMALRSHHAEGLPDTKSTGVAKVDSDPSNNSTRDRVRQKLQNIKTFSHRHSSSLYGHHRLHHYDFRHSASDLSGSDEAKNDSGPRMRLGRSGTLTSNSNDLLEKQMMEMVAKEARERELERAGANDERIGYSSIMSPELKTPLSPPLSHSLSRPGSKADTSDSDRRCVSDQPRLASPHRRQPIQRSADVAELPTNRSFERVSSFVASPELLPSKANVAEPSTLSPPFSPAWSRSRSPTRNPLSKIRDIIRERSGDSSDCAPLTDVDQGVDHRASAQDVNPPPEKVGVPNRRTPSPTKKHGFERPSEGWKMHRRSGSLLQRLDEQGAGLRGMFKGPRIDTVLRGGVSRLGDIIWKKDGSGEPWLEVDSTDESEGERVRGRHRVSSPPLHGQSTGTLDENRHGSKNFLDSMPEFSHAPRVRSHGAGNGHAKEAAHGPTSQSDRSSRFELLKPPLSGTRSVSPSASPLAHQRARVGDLEAWESGSWQGSVVEGARNADERLDDAAEPRVSDQRQSRHWSIADFGCPATKTQLSRCEIFRTRALILSSGIKAMEISRRANEVHEPFARYIEALTSNRASSEVNRAGIEWAAIARFSPKKQRLESHRVVFCELYPLAAKTLVSAIQASGQRWQVSADRLTTQTSPDLQRRIGQVRSRLVDDLSEMTRRAANEADKTSRDLALRRPLEVKHVTDTIQKMLRRRRRRRLRWVRRALWLMVEWLLVGLMWYVWFVVMILRVFAGVGKGAWRGVKWLLWM